MLKSDAVYTQPPKKLGSIKQGVTSKMANQFKVISLNIYFLCYHILMSLEFWLLMSLESMRLKLMTYI